MTRQHSPNSQKIGICRSLSAFQSQTASGPVSMPTRSKVYDVPQPVIAGFTASAGAYLCHGTEIKQPAQIRL